MNDATGFQRGAWTPALLALQVLTAGCPAGGGAGAPTAHHTADARPFPGEELLAFPTAEGFGARARGGRGGRVIEVLNLADAGPGSLRAAVEAAGPRIVVFRRGGTITLRSALVIRRPYITIAGQTAPGGGIALRNHRSHPGKSLVIDAHDVVIRHLRIRPGAPAGEAPTHDALAFLGGHDIIVDHVSASWAVDEVLEAWYRASGITVQWSIISEALERSAHPKGPHGMGIILGDESTRITVHHCLLAHNGRRNPLVAGGRVDLVNNVVYDYGQYAALARGQAIRAELNFVGNVIKPGPSSDRRQHALLVNTQAPGGVVVHARDNLRADRAPGAPEDWMILPRGLEQVLAPERLAAPAVRTSPPRLAYEEVLRRAGATLPARDAVDRRVVSQVRAGAGAIIDDPHQVGGWPALAAGVAPEDGDRDAMPDAWERRHGLDPADPADGPRDADGDGYTNVEEYLNGTHPGLAHR